MKWIKYNVFQNKINVGTESKPIYEDILLEKKIGYCEENLVIAEKEAYNGEYTIEEDNNVDRITCSPQAFTSYLTFAGNVNANMVSAAFGKGNEKLVTGLGPALAMFAWFKGEDKVTYPFVNLQEMLTINEISHAIYDEVIKSDNLSSLIIGNNYAKGKFMEVCSVSAEDNREDTPSVTQVKEFTVTQEDLLHPFRYSYNLEINQYAAGYTQIDKVYINNVLIDSLTHNDLGVNGSAKSRSNVLKHWGDYGITEPGTYTIKAYCEGGKNAVCKASITIYKAKELYNIVGGE